MSEKDKIVEELNEQSWKATNYISPHEYIMWNESNQDLFTGVADLIQNDGVWRDFLGRKYRYFETDNHRYWIMKGKKQGDTCMNRSALVVDSEQGMIAPSGAETESDFDHPFK